MTPLYASPCCSWRFDEAMTFTLESPGAFGMKIETDEQAYALHEFSKRHRIPSEAVFEIASWGYRMGQEAMRDRAAKAIEGKLYDRRQTLHRYSMFDVYVDACNHCNAAVRSLPLEENE